MYVEWCLLVAPIPLKRTLASVNSVTWLRVKLVLLSFRPQSRGFCYLYSATLHTNRRSSIVRMALRVEIPQSLRSQTLAELRHMHEAAHRARMKSRSYSRFMRDDSECRYWVDAIQYYVDGWVLCWKNWEKRIFHPLQLAGMTMNRVDSQHRNCIAAPRVVPCFLDKGAYFQPIIPTIREKAEALRGSLTAQFALAAPKEVDEMNAADAEPLCTDQAIRENFSRVKIEGCVRVSLECCG